MRLHSDKSAALLDLLVVCSICALQQLRRHCPQLSFFRSRNGKPSQVRKGGQSMSVYIQGSTILVNVSNQQGKRELEHGEFCKSVLNTF